MSKEHTEHYVAISTNYSTSNCKGLRDNSSKTLSTYRDRERVVPKLKIRLDGGTNEGSARSFGMNKNAHNPFKQDRGSPRKYRGSGFCAILAT